MLSLLEILLADGQKKADILKKFETGDRAEVLCAYENDVETGRAVAEFDADTVYIMRLQIDDARYGFTDAGILADLLIRSALNAGINRSAIYAESEICGFDEAFLQLGFTKFEDRFRAFIPDIFKKHCR